MGVVLDVFHVDPEVAIACTQMMIPLVVVCVQCVGIVNLDTVQQDIGAGTAEGLPLADGFPAREINRLLLVKTLIFHWIKMAWVCPLSF